MSLENLARGMFVPEGDAGGWSSYMPSLVRALIFAYWRVGGGETDRVYVKELGCGPASSPFLASLGSPFVVVAYEEDEKWYPGELANDFYHPCKGAAPEYTLAGSTDALPCDVVLVDNGVEARVRDLTALAGNKNCGLIVVHDWDVPVYGYERIIPLFKHRVEDRSKWPFTAILSNTVDLSTWKGYVAT